MKITIGNEPNKYLLRGNLAFPIILIFNFNSVID